MRMSLNDQTKTSQLTPAPFPTLMNQEGANLELKQYSSVQLLEALLKKKKQLREQQQLYRSRQTKAKIEATHKLHSGRAA